MGNYQLFKGLTEQEQKALFKNLNITIRNFKKNMTIMSNLSNANEIGLLKKGTAILVKIDYNGNRSIVSLLKPGEIFGSFLNTGNEELIVQSNDNCEILFLEFNNLFRYSKSEWCQKFINNLFFALFEKINSSNKRIEILIKKTIRERLIDYFQSLQKEQSSNIIRIPFSKTELAEYLAIDRTAMMREIKKMKEEGFIEVDNRKITLIYR